MLPLVTEYPEDEEEKCMYLNQNQAIKFNNLKHNIMQHLHMSKSMYVHAPRNNMYMYNMEKLSAPVKCDSN